MAHGPVQKIRVAEARNQLHRARLVYFVLAMLERQIEKEPPVLVEAFVEPLLDRTPGHLARELIRGERLSAAAKQVARKLIEDEDGCERALGTRKCCPRRPFGQHL